MDGFPGISKLSNPLGGRTAFPNLVSYHRFIELLPSSLIPLTTYLHSRWGTSTGIGFIEQLKHISQIEHSRHRSPSNFAVNLLAGLIAYCHRSRKPSIAIDRFALSAFA